MPHNKFNQYKLLFTMPHNKATQITINNTMEAKCPCGINKVFHNTRDMNMWRKLHNKFCVMSQEANKVPISDAHQLNIQDIGSRTKKSTTFYKDGRQTVVEKTKI